MDILLGTAFIDRSIGGIFPKGRKVLSWSPQPVAIVARKPRNTEVYVVDSSTTKVKEAEQVFDDGKENSLVRVALQVFKQSNTQHYFLVATMSSGFRTLNKDISIKSSMYAPRTGYHVCIIWATFLYPSVQLLQPWGSPFQEHEDRTHVHHKSGNFYFVKVLNKFFMPLTGLASMIERVDSLRIIELWSRTETWASTWKTIMTTTSTEK